MNRGNTTSRARSLYPAQSALGWNLPSRQSLIEPRGGIPPRQAMFAPSNPVGPLSLNTHHSLARLATRATSLVKRADSLPGADSLTSDCPVEKAAQPSATSWRVCGHAAAVAGVGGLTARQASGRPRVVGKLRPGRPADALRGNARRARVPVEISSSPRRIPTLAAAGRPR